MSSIRLLLQIAVQYDLLINHMDVKCAYLNYKIHVDPLKGFEGKNGNYVLKQSSRTCNKTFHTYLITQNFEQLPVDPCSKCQQLNIHHFIIGKQYINSFKNWGRLNEN